MLHHVAGFVLTARTADALRDIDGRPPAAVTTPRWAAAKTPDDFVTVDLASRKLVHFGASDLGYSAAARAVAHAARQPRRRGL